MTTREMQEKVERVTNTLDIPPDKMLSSDILSYLNDAQDKYISEVFKRYYENKQEKLDSLRTLIIKDTEVTIGDVPANKYMEGDLPADYRYLINDRSTTVFCGETKVYANRLTKSEKLYNILGFSFSKTAYDSPVSLVHGNKIRVYYDDFTISELYIDYIREPKEISGTQDCELPESIHQEIVKMAINAIIEVFAPERLQAKLVQDATVKQVD